MLYAVVATTSSAAVSGEWLDLVVIPSVAIAGLGHVSLGQLSVQGQPPTARAPCLPLVEAVLEKAKADVDEGRSLILLGEQTTKPCETCRCAAAMLRAGHTRGRDQGEVGGRAYGQKTA